MDCPVSCGEINAIDKISDMLCRRPNDEDEHERILIEIWNALNHRRRSRDFIQNRGRVTC